MMVVTILVVLAPALYAPSEFGGSPDGRETRLSYSFWILLLGVWEAMNAVFLGNDLFNLYVALERSRWLGCRLQAGFLQSGCCSRRRLPPGKGGGR